MSSVKTSLTEDEMLRAACAKRIYGVSDACIALILGVSNLGRVNEGVKRVLAPLGLTEPGYKERGNAELGLSVRSDALNHASDTC